MLKEILILELLNASCGWLSGTGTNSLGSFSRLSWKNINCEVQHILKIAGFRSGGRKPVTRNNFTNCFSYLKANLFVTAQLSTLIKIISFL